MANTLHLPRHAAITNKMSIHRVPVSPSGGTALGGDVESYISDAVNNIRKLNYRPWYFQNNGVTKIFFFTNGSSAHRIASIDVSAPGAGITTEAQVEFLGTDDMLCTDGSSVVCDANPGDAHGPFYDPVEQQLLYHQTSTVGNGDYQLVQQPLNNDGTARVTGSGSSPQGVVIQLPNDPVLDGKKFGHATRAANGRLAFDAGDK